VNVFNKNLVILLLVICSIGFNNNVKAALWNLLEPEEVVERADVVVLGTYDLSVEEIPPAEHSVFYGMKFNVKKVYKGEKLGTEMVVGLDMDDYGIVNDFQKEQGDFILFLENSYSPFLTPVGGPNGLIRIKNGIIDHYDENRKKFYQNYLKNFEEEKVAEKVIEKEPVKISTPTEPVVNSSSWSLFEKNYYPIIVGILLFVCLLLGRKRLRKITHRY
jgi:hypothetical protein